VPFFSGTGEVLGTFALYAPEPRMPKNSELALLDASGRLAAVAVEHYLLTDRFAHQARHDPLTALPNRMLLEDRLNVAIARARRAPSGDEQIGVFFIDLDGFKVINDTLGHHCGDLLLKQITARLQTTTREADTLARMGGDEFTLVAPAITSREEAAHIARRMLAAIGAPFVLDGRELSVTASIGVAIYPHDGEDCAALQRNADAAMYRAKEMGRNTFEYFNPIMNVQALERLELESMLRRALPRGELAVHYQPQISPDGVVGFEALLRWQHPKLGTISPARFIPVAESTGLILPIGAWVLQQTCRQAKRWQALLGRPMHMSVNVSSLQFAQPGFVSQIAEALRASELPPGLLELELTESVLMHRYGSAAVTLEQVRNLGVGVAIDDFGTGYSSLAYLDRLPIDTLKIDQTFVQEVQIGKAGEADGRDAILRAISSLAHNLNLKLVGEGVETDAQRRFLRHLGCHIMQGHLFSPAVPAEQIPPLVARLDEQFADRRLKRPA
jgi:diguanylate cyclase (GGDEF)-like protein